MRLKPGVSIPPTLHPALLLALMVIDDVYRQTPYGAAIITSLGDGKHMEGSLHARGRAADIRSRNITEGRGVNETKRIFGVIKDTLGPSYDCLLEDLGGENEHIHVEYDPKDVVGVGVVTEARLLGFKGEIHDEIVKVTGPTLPPGDQSQT